MAQDRRHLGTDVEALLGILQARSEDPALPLPERGKASAALTALRELGTQVTSEVVATWLRSQGFPDSAQRGR